MVFGRGHERTVSRVLVRARALLRSSWVLTATLGAAQAGCSATPTPLAPKLGGSVGLPHRGVQTGATELPARGRGFRRLRPASPHHWGQPRLVETVRAAAAAVDAERPGGPALVVGDLSARHGGRIPGHRSHRTGRDVDLLWYLTTPSGASIETSGFVDIGEDGLGQDPATGTFVRLDIPREWALVKALLRQGSAPIEWLFVNRPIEALLIEHARAVETDLALLWEAETVLQQPRGVQDHADHFHVRIACLPEERAQGCGGGPRWDWLPPEPSLATEAPGWLAELLAESAAAPVAEP